MKLELRRRHQEGQDDPQAAMSMTLTGYRTMMPTMKLYTLCMRVFTSYRSIHPVAAGTLRCFRAPNKDGMSLYHMMKPSGFVTCKEVSIVTTSWICSTRPPVSALAALYDI